MWSCCSVLSCQSNSQTSHLIKRPGSGDDVIGAALKQQADIIPDIFIPQILWLQETPNQLQKNTNNLFGNLCVITINEGSKLQEAMNYCDFKGV